MTEPRTDFGNSGQKKGRGMFAAIAVFIILVGVLFLFSLSNSHKYQLRRDGERLTVLKGRLSPQGTEIVESFEPRLLDNARLGEIDGKSFASRNGAYAAIVSHLMSQVDVELAKENKADITKLNKLLDKVESILDDDFEESRDMAQRYFQLAQKRVAVAEMATQRAYEKALPAYEEALKLGLEDADTLRARIEAIRKASGHSGSK